MDASGLNPSRRDKIPVPVWNRVVRAADFVEQFAHGAQGEASFSERASNLLLAKNVTGATLDRYSVVRFSGVQTDPALSDAAKASFLSRPILTASEPEGGDVSWGITVDPIAANGVGRIAIDGVVPVKISVSVESHKYAKTQEYGTSQLASCDAEEGAATIIWKEEGTGAKWALIRFGGGGGGAVRLGKTTALWTKGTIATIDLYEQGPAASEAALDPAEQVDAVNKFTDIDADKWVIVAKARAGQGSWYLISAECG